MEMDLLKPLVPQEYKFRQKVLDTMIKIARANPKPTCHQDEIVKVIKDRKEKIEIIILYLVRNDYAKHVGQSGEPIYAVTGKGQTASIDREFFRTGRNERYKNVLAYGAWLGLISTTLAIATALYIAPKVVQLQERIESLEKRVSQQSQVTPGETVSLPKQNLQPSTSIDSVSVSRDSAMFRTVVNENKNP